MPRKIMSFESKYWSRDQLGKLVRDVWIRWAQQQPNPKPSWLVPWDQLGEADREVDRQIGEVLYGLGKLHAVENAEAAIHAVLR